MKSACDSLWNPVVRVPVCGIQLCVCRSVESSCACAGSVQSKCACAGSVESSCACAGLWNPSVHVLVCGIQVCVCRVFGIQVCMCRSVESKCACAGSVEFKCANPKARELTKLWNPGALLSVSVGTCQFQKSKRTCDCAVCTKVCRSVRSIPKCA
jgi:hypothetical protein